MCQFCTCQPWDESSQELFQPISSETAANVRAGWWAYHYQNTHNPSGSDYASDYVAPGPSYQSSQTVGSIHGSIPTYGYGYGTDF